MNSHNLVFSTLGGIVERCGPFRYAFLFLGAGLLLLALFFSGNEKLIYEDSLVVSLHLFSVIFFTFGFYLTKKFPFEKYLIFFPPACISVVLGIGGFVGFWANVFLCLSFWVSFLKESHFKRYVYLLVAGILTFLVGVQL